MQTVLQLAEVSRRILGRMLADVPEELMCHQPAGLKNHPAWQVGHMIVPRSGIARLLGGDAGVSEEWLAPFKPGSDPCDDRSCYPKKEELLATFDSAQSAVLGAVGRAPDAALDAPTPIPSLAPVFPTVRVLAAAVFSTHDGLHLGQLSVWRRAMGLPRVL